jgi:hypothetical protein
MLRQLNIRFIFHLVRFRTLHVLQFRFGLLTFQLKQFICVQ